MFLKHDDQERGKRSHVDQIEKNLFDSHSQCKTQGVRTIATTILRGVQKRIGHPNECGACSEFQLPAVWIDTLKTKTDSFREEDLSGASWHKDILLRCCCDASPLVIDSHLLQQAPHDTGLESLGLQLSTLPCRCWL